MKSIKRIGVYYLIEINTIKDVHSINRRGPQELYRRQRSYLHHEE